MISSETHSVSSAPEKKHFFKLSKIGGSALAPSTIMAIRLGFTEHASRIHLLEVMR